MRNNINTLIIPDVHGRDFWREPVKDTLENTDAKVVFLGDYLDPYIFEWPEDMSQSDIRNHAIQGLQDIIELKQTYPDRITLLLGNHDCGYMFTFDICDCRTDTKNVSLIRDIFRGNYDLFDLIKLDSVGGRDIIYSHAGVDPEFMKMMYPEETISRDNIEELCNIHGENNKTIIDYLGVYDCFRGWTHCKHGSMVWADIRSWQYATETPYGYNICGHTMLESDPVVMSAITCLDCQCAFYINNNGDLLRYDDDKLIK